MPLSNYGLNFLPSQPPLSSDFQSSGVLGNIFNRQFGQMQQQTPMNFGGGINYAAQNPVDNAGGGSWMDATFGNSKTGQQGWAMPAISAFTGLAGAYLGMKQYGLAKNAFKESKRQFQTNFDAQAQTVNRSIANDYEKGQAAARVSGVGGSNLSQAEYMAKWGVGNKDNRDGRGG